MADISTLTRDTQEAVEDLFDFAADRGLFVEIRSARRSCEQQNGLFDIGREIPGSIVTDARGCQSWHVLGRAIDITIPGAPRSEYERLGEFWESIGGHWGGRFSNIDDVGHFEWHPGLKIEDICPNPFACERVVKEHLLRPNTPRPIVEMAAVALVSAVAMVWWLK